MPLRRAILIMIVSLCKLKQERSVQHWFHPQCHLNPYIHKRLTHVALYKYIWGGQSAAMSHSCDSAVMKKSNKIILLKHDKRLCMNYKIDNEIWKWWKNSLPDIVATWKKKRNRIVT